MKMVKAALKMKTWLVFTAACLTVQRAESTVLLPEEVSTLAALIYSLLPPIRLGQDSRFGFGFRLGRNADAQFLIELGPQQATEPLGNESKKREVYSNKRKVLTPAERVKLLRELMEKITRSEFVESISHHPNTSMSIISKDNKSTIHHPKTSMSTTSDDNKSKTHPPKTLRKNTSDDNKSTTHDLNASMNYTSSENKPHNNLP